MTRAVEDGLTDRAYHIDDEVACLDDTCTHCDCARVRAMDDAEHARCRRRQDWAMMAEDDDADDDEDEEDEEKGFEYPFQAVIDSGASTHIMQAPSDHYAEYDGKGATSKWQSKAYRS